MAGLQRQKGRAESALTLLSVAIGRLIACLGDDDEGEVMAAARVLCELGGLAVEPLGRALLRPVSPRHGVVIAGVLLTLGGCHRELVIPALSKALEHGTDPALEHVVQRALSRLILEDPGGPVARLSRPRQVQGPGGESVGGTTGRSDAPGL